MKFKLESEATGLTTFQKDYRNRPFDLMSVLTKICQDFFSR